MKISQAVGSIKNVLLRSSLVLTVFAASVCNAGVAVEEGSLLVSIDANKQPLGDVLSEISRKTEWTVLIDENLANIPVSGTFKDIELESLLKRALKGENLIVLYDEESKTIEVRAFGANGIETAEIADSLQAIMPDEKTLQALRAKEEKVWEEYISNPDSIEPMTGMTLGEISALHAAEQQAWEEYNANPDSIEPMTGMTLGEISALHAAEQQAWEEYLANPDSV
jgi:hypothetical protein